MLKFLSGLSFGAVMTTSYEGFVNANVHAHRYEMRQRILKGRSERSFDDENRQIIGYRQMN
jgi:hypothetical protein